mmetsp:Transcript_24747/g.69304  ORF Transcript_24747/g.69304 Transcript_24747/m.69304 type:complete len:237 (+) Transcript_24747:904-1614(+)
MRWSAKITLPPRRTRGRLSSGSLIGSPRHAKTPVSDISISTNTGPSTCSTSRAEEAMVVVSMSEWYETISAEPWMDTKKVGLIEGSNEPSKFTSMSTVTSMMRVSRKYSPLRARILADLSTDTSAASTTKLSESTISSSTWEFSVISIKSASMLPLSTTSMRMSHFSVEFTRSGLMKSFRGCWRRRSILSSLRTTDSRRAFPSASRNGKGFSSKPKSSRSYFSTSNTSSRSSEWYT